MKQFVGEVIEQVYGAEVKRVRARQPKARAVFERQIETVICEAAYHHLNRPGKWIAYTRSKSKLGNLDRYQSSVMGRCLPKLVDLLGGPSMGLLEVRAGVRSPFVSEAREASLRASPLLAQLLGELGIDYSDFGRAADEETIILKGPKSRQEKPRKIPYEESCDTVRFRNELQTINARIENARIDGIGDDVNVYDRKLRRYFNNGSFEQGGRLFGGFWQGMTKDARRSIVIDGCPTLALDFSQAGPMLLYGLVGERYGGDAYAVPGYEYCRGGIKKLFAAFTQVSGVCPEFKRILNDHFPDSTSLSQVRDAILAHHSPVADQFFTGIGMQVMRLESDIMVAILMSLAQMGIVALPIHDALIVRRDQARRAEEVMLSVFESRTGMQGRVSIE